MALAKKNVSIALAQGVDTKSDPKQVMPGKLLLLQNGLFQTADEIRKRNGYQTFPQTTTVVTTLSNSIVPSKMNSGNFTANFNNELIANDGFNLYSQSNATSSYVWKGNAPICSLSTNFVVRNKNSQTMQDCAANTTTQIFAWEDSSTGGVMLAIVDIKTGNVILNNYAVSSNGQSPKCVAISGLLYCFYYDTSTHHISFVYWNGLSISSPANAATDPNTTYPNFDVIAVSQNIFLAYNSAANGVCIANFTSFMTAVNIIKKGAESAQDCITAFTDTTNNIWIAYNDDTTTKAFIVDYGIITTLLAPTAVETISTVKNITGIVIGTTATLFYDVIGNAVNSYYINSKIRFNTLTYAGTAGTAANFVLSATLQSRAFLIAFNGTYIPHVTVVHDANLQPTYFVLALYNTTSFANFTVVAKIAPSVAGSIPVRSQLANAFQLSPTSFMVALLEKDELFTSATSTGSVATFTQTGVISATFNFAFTNPSALQLGNNLHFGGAYLQMYDGNAVVEHGFHLYPDPKEMTFTPATAGGHLTDSSTYGIIVLYEWIDNQGQVHRSNPSPSYSATTGNSGSNVCQVTVVIPTLRITGKANVNIVIYRTAANGTVYYRDNLPSSPKANSLTANTVSYVITQADSSVIANEQLYTTGGEVGNIAAPAATTMCIYKNRLILIPSEDTFSWWFSKQVIPGTPVEFSNLFVENVDNFAGGISACAQMDNSLVLFKQNLIYPIYGEGPSPSGANNDFTDPVALSTDTGCSSFQSVVLTQLGLMYQSPKGLYLLDRSLQNSYIGAPVEAFNSYTVTSAQLIRNVNQVRFTISNGTALVYDYFFNQWSVFTNHSAVSSVNAVGGYTLLSSSGVSSQETVGSYTDSGNFIQLQMVLSWLSLAGVQGFQRVYEMLLLGAYKGPHQLLVQVAYDFENFFTQQDYINATVLMDQNIYGEDATYGLSSPFGGTNTLYQWRVFFQRQKCEAISITIQDVQPLGLFTNSQGYTVNLNYNEGFSLSNIALIYGVKDGLFKLPASSAVG